jgi:hypothetical protein
VPVPPAVTGAVLRGRVVDSLAQPIAGATVTAEATRPRVGIAPCAADSFPESIYLPLATTDTGGNFGGQLFSPYSPAQRCIRVVVVAPGGGPAVVRDSLLLFFGAAHRRDTLAISVIMP